MLPHRPQGAGGTLTTSLAATVAADAVHRLEAAGHGGDRITGALRHWLARPIGVVEPAWDNYYRPSVWAAPFLERMATIRLARGDALAFGMFAVSPGTDYPEHGHDARELYLAISGDPLFMRDGGWRELEPGAATIQEPGVVHALRTRSQPALFFWAWTGAIDSQIWGFDTAGKRFVPPYLDVEVSSPLDSALGAEPLPPQVEGER